MISSEIMKFELLQLSDVTRMTITNESRACSRATYNTIAYTKVS